MKFDGTFELEDTTAEKVWLALSDPVLIEQALPGCEFLVPVEGTDVDFDELRETVEDRDPELSNDPDVIAERAFEEGQSYAAVLQMSVGPVNPTFETVVTIDHRGFPEMSAVGEGGSGDSSFEMSSSMALSETDDSTVVEWETEADVFGRIAQMGQRIINPAANQIVKRFFSGVQSELDGLGIDEENSASSDNGNDQGLVDRLLGRSDESDG